MVTRLALVDDDQNILTSVALMLEAEGYEVDTYFDSEQALSGLLRRPPALAVLDIKMPRMDGTELLGKLRQRSSLPVIFLTSKDDELDEALGLGMGADDYIPSRFPTSSSCQDQSCVAPVRFGRQRCLFRSVVSQGSGAGS